MTSARLQRAVLAACVLLVACGRGNDPYPTFGLTCTSDEDCPSQMVCFADGCGDPGVGIVAEVLPSRSGAQYPQDLDLGTLGASDTLLLSPSLSFDAKLLRPTATGVLVPYAATAVSIQATGESELIPGLKRRYVATVPAGTSTFSFPVGSGRYTFSATAADPTIPPRVLDERLAVSGAPVPLAIDFAGATAIRTVTGLLFHTLLDRAPVLTSEIEVQAFDLDTRQPLSQPALVAADGAFVLSVVPPKAPATSFALRAHVKDPAAFVPDKEWQIPAASTASLELELGDYGDPVSYSGSLVSEDGVPIAEAMVYLQGPVAGGGTFRSAAVATDAKGAFTLRTLPSPVGVNTRLWAVPPEASKSGVLSSALEIPALPTAPLTFVAPDKVRVTGVVHRPGSSDPAAGVKVIAEPIAARLDEPLPYVGAETVTALDGRYALYLDPAVYRIDFVPGEQLPRVSRFVDVFAGARPREQQLATFSLSRGRKAQGVVKVVTSAFAPEPQPSPFTSVRLFRRSYTEGRFTAQLLGEAVTDDLGRYSVVLPAATDQ